MKPTLRVPVAALRPGVLELDADTTRYVARVHRRGAGDALCLFDPEAGTQAEARIESSAGARLSCLVFEVTPAKVGSMPVTLLQALGKGDKPEQAISDATVLGAERVLLVETERSVAKLRGDTRSERHHRVAVAAARQSGRGQLPEVVGPLGYGDALESLDATRRLVCAWHPSARPLLVALEDWDGRAPLALLIGPEGGLSGPELEAALARGFEAVSLGPWVLRTETAATVALGVVSAVAAARAAK